MLVCVGVTVGFFDVRSSAPSEGCAMQLVSVGGQSREEVVLLAEVGRVSPWSVVARCRAVPEECV